MRETRALPLAVWAAEPSPPSPSCGIVILAMEKATTTQEATMILASTLAPVTVVGTAAPQIMGGAHGQLCPEPLLVELADGSRFAVRPSDLVDEADVDFDRLAQIESYGYDLAFAGRPKSCSGLSPIETAARSRGYAAGRLARIMGRAS